MNTYEIIEIGGFWRVMCNQVLISTHASKAGARAAIRRYEQADKRRAAS